VIVRAGILAAMMAHHDIELAATIDRLLARDPAAMLIGRDALARIANAVYLSTPLHPDRMLPTPTACALVGIGTEDFIAEAKARGIKPRRLATGNHYWRAADCYLIRSALANQTNGANDAPRDSDRQRPPKGTLRRIK